MNNRRKLVIALGAGALAAPFGSFAQQQPVRIRRIGILLATSASDPEWPRRIGALTEALRALGWAEGKNLAIELRHAEGKPEQLPALAAELVQANVDVIVTQGAQPINAARKATSIIPIVMAQSGNAVESGFVASLAHPGGNVTGLTLVSIEQVVKRLQLIKDFSPNFIRVAAFWNATSPAHRLQMREMELAVPKLGIVLQSLPNRSPEEIDSNLQAAVKAKAQIIFTMDDPLVESHRARIVEFAMRQRLPVMGEFRPMATAGALMSYSPNQVDMWRRVAPYIDKIFKGTKPADLPVEQPTRFELIINLKTAKTLRLTVPPRLLAIADDVIE